MIVYSSVTGNTRLVAEAIREEMPPDTVFAAVHKAPDPAAFDLLALGFWVHRGGPDPRMARYMSRVRDKHVAWFGTLAAWPESDHAIKVSVAADDLLRGNRILGGFLCQGKLEARRFAAVMSPGYRNSSHPMTLERRARLLEAAKHPDSLDLARARACIAEYVKAYLGIT